MKKNSVVTLMVFVMVFAVSGSAFAAPRWGGYNNIYQQGQNQYQINSGQTNAVSNQSGLQFFTDIPQNHWAYNVIKDMKQLGVINGDSDGNFYPDRQVTRAEFATMLVRALHLTVNQGATQTFTDVASNFWGYNYIEAAQNYLTGYQNANGQLYFDPQDPAVREDIVVALVRAEGLGNEQPDLSVLSNFVDANNISANLKGYVAIAVKHDLVKGSTDQTGQYHLYPQNKLTRAEAAAFLDRILQGNKIITGQQSDSQQDTKVIVGQQSVTQTQQAPELVTAAVNGATLTLTYNENLDTSSVPYVSDFAINVNGTAQASPIGLTVSGNSVTMALYQAILTGSTVSISYTPGTHPIRDLTGYNASALVNYQVSNATSDTIAPVWPQGSALSISNLSGNGLTLTWPQATDNTGVTAYRVYQDGNLLATVAGSVYSYNVAGLSPNTAYAFRIDAGDAAGNWTTGPSVNITTN